MQLKHLLAGLCCLLVLCTAHAQDNPPAYIRSAAFDEPESGSGRLLMMSNGNTLFFHFTEKKGIDVTVYDEKHRVKTKMNNRVSSWKQKKMRRAQMKGFYEINGEAVVFMMYVKSRKPVLYRLHFDAKTGRKTKELAVADLPRIGLGMGYGMAFGGLSIPDFTISKDPRSGYYAIGLFNSLSSDRNARIEVRHFSPEHKMINRAYYGSPKGKYKYLQLLDMHVDKDQFVFLGGYAYNTKASGGEDSRILLGSLSKGEKEFETKVLDYTDDYKRVRTAIRQRQEDGLLYFLTAVDAESVGRKPLMDKGKKTTGYALEMHIIDPASLDVKKHYFLEHPQLTKYAADRLKLKRQYFGVIQDFRLNRDSTITYMFEELDNYTTTSVSTTTTNGRTSTSTRSRYFTDLGAIGVMNANLDGKELRGYAIAKNQTVETTLDMFEVNTRRLSNWNFRAKAGFKNISGFYSYDYLLANGRDYVIYNDYPKNTDAASETSKSKKTVRYISDANTIYAYFDGKSMVKSYLFGEPKNKSESRFCQLEMNTWSEDEKTLATMMIEKRGRDKKAYIVWMNF
ncbi:hypothetical protein MKQ68_18000 [Chitinophaga horti]|uniref:Uncharacterized protein n=1 Tax=Chitinophaga horti TaxID=2920382 RepID=A0ABY6IXQ4_9BACT|nr:hypothetical protein [Chitinophaga horti]UYQ91981.1 hypothetical protein MKQ68_18000 [Chitinophaga horti]